MTGGLELSILGAGASTETGAGGATTEEVLGVGAGAGGATKTGEELEVVGAGGACCCGSKN
jgi:hypothetical protein